MIDPSRVDADADWASTQANGGSSLSVASTRAALSGTEQMYVANLLALAALSDGVLEQTVGAGAAAAREEIRARLAVVGFWPLRLDGRAVPPAVEEPGRG